ncbi:MAG: beta/gamma crystallin family protein [Caulobacteraceae bacterium]|nr:beta/gamma crystallin-related protein [Caulobacter sp. CCUG 60055]MBQ1541330.1 beta/gamma crystallin family protein [Caulobacteraceae bacterium]
MARAGSVTAWALAAVLAAWAPGAGAQAPETKPAPQGPGGPQIQPPKPQPPRPQPPRPQPPRPQPPRPKPPPPRPPAPRPPPYPPGHHHRPPHGPASLTLYSDLGWRGRALRVSHSIPNLAATPMNDRALSIHVRGGRWELCRDANYRGRCVFVTSSVSDLRRLGLGHSISSVRRR